MKTFPSVRMPLPVFLGVFTILSLFVSAATGSECPDGSAASSFSRYDLSPTTHLDVASTSTHITFVMRSTKEAYLSVGFSPDGTMVGKSERGYNIAVIGDGFGVRKFALTGSDDPNDVRRMSGEDQTLINATFVQYDDDDGEDGEDGDSERNADNNAGPFDDVDIDVTSVLTFTRRLDDTTAASGGDTNTAIDVLPPTGEIGLIWAVGDDNFLLGHAEFGAVRIPVSPCRTFDASDIVVTRPPGKVLVDIHAIMAAVAFGFLMPLGVFSSAFRAVFRDDATCFSKKMWYFLHGASMGGGSLLAVLATILAVVAKTETSSTKHFRNGHEVVGLIVVAVIVLQVVYANFFRPPGPPPPKTAKESPSEMVDTTDHDEIISDEDREEDKELGIVRGAISNMEPEETTMEQEETPRDDGDDNDENDKAEAGAAARDAAVKVEEKKPASTTTTTTTTTTAIGQKSFARKFWEYSHAMSGIAIVLAGAYQIKSGLDIYETRYYVNAIDDAMTEALDVMGIVYWVWLGITVGFLAVVAYRYVVKKELLGTALKKIS